MRLLGWLSKLLISVLLISFLTIFTTAYIVDLYINRILEQWNLGDIARPSIGAEDYVSKLVDPSQIWEQDTVANQETVKSGEGSGARQGNGLEFENENGVGQEVGDGQGNEFENKQVSGDGHGDDEELIDDDQAAIVEDSAIPVFNHGQVNDNRTEAQKDTLVMSAQEFNERRKNLTIQDKTAIFSMMITRLPQSELQKMSLILEDGITEEELTNLMEVMNAYLEQEEVEKLLAILNKYEE